MDENAFFPFIFESLGILCAFEETVILSSLVKFSSVNLVQRRFFFFCIIQFGKKQLTLINCQKLRSVFM